MVLVQAKMNKIKEFRKRENFTAEDVENFMADLNLGEA